MQVLKKMTIAKKANPNLWKKAKKLACTKAGLCKHSARKMQWATRYYKSHGGRYIGNDPNQTVLLNGESRNGALRVEKNRAVVYDIFLQKHGKI